MSAYTTISNTVNSKEATKFGQVKIWNDETGQPAVMLVGPGDMVPSYLGASTYSIAMREGGFVVIIDNELKVWQEAAPTGMVIYDKWGDEFISKELNTGLLGEPY